MEVGGNLTKAKDSGDGDEEVEVVEDKKVIDEAEMWRIAQEAAERAKRAAEEGPCRSSLAVAMDCFIC